MSRDVTLDEQHTPPPAFRPQPRGGGARGTVRPNQAGGRIAMTDHAESMAGTMEVRETHRFDTVALERYMRAHVPGFTGSLTVRQFVGGQSNPTYCLRDDAHDYVLRRKPPGKLLPSAHAVDREYRVITAL